MAQMNSAFGAGPEKLASPSGQEPAIPEAPRMPTPQPGPTPSPEPQPEQNRAPAFAVAPSQQPSPQPSVDPLDAEVNSFLEQQLAGIKPPRTLDFMGDYREHPNKGWQKNYASKGQAEQWEPVHEADKLALREAYDLVAAAPEHMAMLGVQAIPGSSILSRVGRTLGLGGMAGYSSATYDERADSSFGADKAQAMRDIGGIKPPSAWLSAILAGGGQGIGEALGGFFGAQVKKTDQELRMTARASESVDKAKQLATLAEGYGVNLTPAQTLAGTELGPYAAMTEQEMAKDFTQTLRQNEQRLEAMRQLDGGLTRLKVIVGNGNTDPALSFSRMTPTGVNTSENFVQRIVREKGEEIGQNARLIEDMSKSSALAKETKPGSGRFVKPEVSRDALQGQVMAHLAETYGDDLIAPNGAIKFPELQKRIATDVSGQSSSKQLFRFLNKYFSPQEIPYTGKAAPLVEHNRPIIPQEGPLPSNAAPSFQKKMETRQAQTSIQEQLGLPLVDKGEMVTVGMKDYTKSSILDKVQVAKATGKDSINLGGMKTPISAIESKLGTEAAEPFSQKNLVTPTLFGPKGETMAELAQQSSTYQQHVLAEKELRANFANDPKYANLPEEAKRDILARWRAGKLQSFSTEAGAPVRKMDVRELANMVRDAQELADNTGAYGGNTGSATDKRLSSAYAKMAADLRETAETHYSNVFEQLGMKDKAVRMIQGRNQHSRLLNSSTQLSQLVDQHKDALGALITHATTDDFGVLVQNMGQGQKQELAGMAIQNIQDKMLSVNVSSGGIDRINAKELYSEVVGKLRPNGAVVETPAAKNLKLLIGEQKFGDLRDMLRIGSNIQQASENMSGPALIKQATSLAEKSMRKLGDSLDVGKIGNLVFDMYKKRGQEQQNRVLRDALDMIEGNYRSRGEALAKKSALYGVAAEGARVAGTVAGEVAERKLNRLQSRPSGGPSR